MAIGAVLFDIDGTLVDSNEQHVAAWEVAFREAGVPQTANAIRRQIGKGGDMLIPALLPDADDDARERIAARQGEVFKADHLANVSPFDGAADLVSAVYASGRTVVLASSAKREELDHYVDLLGIADVVDAASCSDDVDASKPAPDIFAAALGKAGVDAAEAIAIGDTIYDIEAAEKAGIKAIGLTSGPFGRDELSDAGAIAIYADAAALLARAVFVGAESVGIHRAAVF